MSDCHELRDLMPEVAGKRRQWTAAQSHHLSECGECAVEWRLIVLTRAIGTTEQLVDLERVVARRRSGSAVETPPAGPIGLRPRSRRWAWTGLGLAAAAALLLTLAQPDPSDRVETAAGRLVLTELDDLDANELETVLTALDVEEETMGAVDGNLDGLTTDELELMLGSEEP